MLDENFGQAYVDDCDDWRNKLKNSQEEAKENIIPEPYMTITIELPDDSWCCPKCKSYATIDQVTFFDAFLERVEIFCDYCEESVAFDSDGKGTILKD